MKTLRIAYFDCYSGISGDMILGALVDMGVDIREIRKALKNIDLGGYKLEAKKVKRSDLSCTQILVKLEKQKSRQPHRSFSNIKKLIEKSGLPSRVKKNSIEIFKRIAKVEAGIHNTTVDKIHFHEVGGIDSIVDIVGGVWAIESLKLDKIYSSPLNVGEGLVDCAHGRLPVPAPATLKLLKGIPVFSSGVKNELTTPTGAAMIAFYAEKFQSMPAMTIAGEGSGAGSRVISSIPNMLRVFVGETSHIGTNELVMIETNIDDMNPEVFEAVMESLFKEGALDVFFSSIMMKKNRPATQISVLAENNNRERLSRILLTETSSFGVRFYGVDRMTLDREVKKIKTPYGSINIKIGLLDGKIVQAAPEFEDCKKASRAKKRPVKKIYDEIHALAQKKWLS
ncbi:MAG: nickel pincer cofactor biosynthesis protein LarC [Nitrospinae bacterium]|nr:nickel pincer cofactor biosynthesis protein LarC [Nitrospinota bacterium]